MAIYVIVMPTRKFISTRAFGKNRTSQALRFKAGAESGSGATLLFSINPFSIITMSFAIASALWEYFYHGHELHRFHRKYLETYLSNVNTKYLAISSLSTSYFICTVLQ